jgi:hypothetical protein
MELALLAVASKCLHADEQQIRAPRAFAVPRLPVQRGLQPHAQALQALARVELVASLQSEQVPVLAQVVLA